MVFFTCYCRSNDFKKRTAVNVIIVLKMPLGTLSALFRYKFWTILTKFIFSKVSCSLYMLQQHSTLSTFRLFVWIVPKLSVSFAVKSLSLMVFSISFSLFTSFPFSRGFYSTVSGWDHPRLLCSVSQRLTKRRWPYTLPWWKVQCVVYDEVGTIIPKWRRQGDRFRDAVWSS